MSSTERAPEPTMEEILASIRRIISEDEASAEQAAPQSAAASGDDEDHLEVVEGEADDKIINDIARVLSGSAPASAEEPVEEPIEELAEEDILDLTAELGGLEPVETLELVEEIEIEEIVIEEPLELEPDPEPEPEPEPVAAFVELETPVELEPQPEPEPEPVLQAAPPQPEPAPVAFEPPQRKLSASEEAASALERAIAALRAGQVPTSAPPAPSYMSTPEISPQPAPRPLFGAEPAPSFTPTPMPAPGFIPLPETQAEAAPEPAPEPESEPELVLTEFEVETTETLVVELEPADEPEDTASEPDYMAPLTNGSGPHEDAAETSALPEGSAKAIEESVKDILRPMLQQWLNENMARVVTAALKDEIREHPARFQPD